MNTARIQALIEKARETREKRKKMLLSLKGDISITLYDVLAQKIEIESESLMALIAADEKSEETKREEASLLPKEFFVLKRLDLTSL